MPRTFPNGSMTDAVIQPASRGVIGWYSLAPMDSSRSKVAGDAAAERGVVQLHACRAGARRHVVDQRPLDPVAGVDQAVQQPHAAAGGGGGGVDRVPPPVG